jgi:hypothetical protein
VKGKERTETSLHDDDNTAFHFLPAKSDVCKPRKKNHVVVGEMPDVP